MKKITFVVQRYNYFAEKHAIAKQKSISGGIF